jgi:hypothetical protein
MILGRLNLHRLIDRLNLCDVSLQLCHRFIVRELGKLQVLRQYGLLELLSHCRVILDGGYGLIGIAGIGDSLCNPDYFLRYVLRFAAT